jgi:nitrate/TMAO reductase-like tetraheme cytochrome c subunit
MSVPLKRPSLLSRKTFFGTTIGAALVFMAVGVIFWGGFNTAMEVTNTKEFCISCHEMEENVYQEFQGTVHDGNRSGVGAGCPDCHVPRPWVHKVVRKIQASNELFHKVMGTVSTPEKFEQHRLTMAKRVWAAMKNSDSRECRNCHDFSTMAPDKQKPRAYQQHLNAIEKGNTCIDCHKGIAHKKVHDQLTEEESEALEAPNPRFIRELPPRWLAFQAKQEAQNAAAATLPPVTAVPASLNPLALDASDSSDASAAHTAAATSTTDTDWSRASSRQVVVFYPGQASLEWVLTGSEHSGARAVIKAGDRCSVCHDKEAADIGQKIVSGEKVEPQPIAGKRGSIAVTVRAAHDADNLYLRFEWPDSPHVPVPFVDGGKMDAENQVKLALMISDDSVEYASQSGCWATCHHDLHSMPDEAHPHATKYLKESRTELQIRPAADKKRGGFDQRRDEAEIQTALENGKFIDLMRVKSGNGGISESGYVLAERHLQPSGSGEAEFSAHLDNGIWVVVLKRPLKPAGAGEIALEPGTLYNIGFAIHDDYSNARWHHVSLGYKLGLDHSEADINALAQ